MVHKSDNSKANRAKNKTQSVPNLETALPPSFHMLNEHFNDSFKMFKFLNGMMTNMIESGVFDENVKYLSEDNLENAQTICERIKLEYKKFGV